MLHNDLMKRLVTLPADTPLAHAHVLALYDAQRAPDPVGALTGVPAELLDTWRIPVESHTVRAAQPPARYRLGAVLDGLSRQDDAADALNRDASRLATAFPMFTYADGADDDFITSLQHTEDPVTTRILRIPIPFDLPAGTAIGAAEQTFLNALLRDPDALPAAARRLPARTLESFNLANWLLAEFCRPELDAAHLHEVAESISLLADEDFGLGVNAYGHAESQQEGLVTRLSFTMSHLVAGLPQTSRLLNGSSSGYAALVTTLIKLGADFALEDDQGRNAMQVATGVRRQHVSSPFLNLIDKFLLVQQLDEMMLHGDDENADKI